MKPAPPRILIVEDSPTQVEVARVFLAPGGYDIRVATTAQQALQIAAEWPPDAILLDLDLPDFSGLELMRRLRTEGIDAEPIVVTADASIKTAVEAMREGATDFLVKPFARARLNVTLANVLERRQLATELRSARTQLDRGRFHGFIGASPAMQAVYRTIEAAAPSRANVFITGESGTGKELAADAVHKASPRRNKPFIALNCGAIPRDLLESEVFGHTKGAFTGATDNRMGAAKAADGGTLFLDEIGEMPLDMQVKLLRFVQTGSFTPVGSSRPEKVDVRIVSATNRDPLAEVEVGRFREDLYYRLYVVPIELPPLRARGDDIALIARDFLARFAREEHKKFRGFTPETEQILRGYHWPGNVRQLQNVIRNIVVLHDAERVSAAMLPPMLLRTAASGRIVEMPPPPVPVPVPAIPVAEVPEPMAAPVMEPEPDDEADAPVYSPPAYTSPAYEPPAYQPTAYTPPVEEPSPAPEPVAEAAIKVEPLWLMEKRLILAALEQTSQDVPRAAALLEVNPSTIYRKLQAWRSAKGG